MRPTYRCGMTLCLTCHENWEFQSVSIAAAAPRVAVPPETQWARHQGETILRIPCWLISIQQGGSESKLTPLRSRTSSVSPSRAQSSSPSRRPARRASSSESPFTGGSTVRGKAGDGGNPLDKYVPFDQFRASRGQDSVNYSAKASSSSYTAAATSYSSSALRYRNNYATK